MLRACKTQWQENVASHCHCLCFACSMIDEADGLRGGSCLGLQLLRILAKDGEGEERVRKKERERGPGHS